MTLHVRKARAAPIGATTYIRSMANTRTPSPDARLLRAAMARAGSQSQLARDAGIGLRTIHRYSLAGPSLEITRPVYRLALRAYLDRPQVTAR